MIDVHSHIFPFVDDGSCSIEQSLTMLKEMEAQGVTDVICTPHYGDEYVCEIEKLQNAFSELNKEKDNKGINVNLYLGQEILYDKKVKANLLNGKNISLNGTPYLLVEFDYCSDFDMTEAVYTLVKEGYKPIVAHFERYTFVDVMTAQEIKNLGGYIQVNASSLVNKFGCKFGKRTKTLFAEDLVDFVASDLHFIRKNKMKTAYKIVEKKYGKEKADIVFVENPKKIINGQT